MIKTIQDRNNSKFGEVTELEDGEEKKDLSIKAYKYLGDEMVTCSVGPTDYIEQGYRCYNMSELPAPTLARNLPNICRKHRLEILLIRGVMYVKDTNKYDHRKNPYT